MKKDKRAGITRTKIQVKRIKTGCKKRDKTLIINAQKKRHLKIKINQAILNKLKTMKNIETAQNWIQQVENATSEVVLQKLLAEIDQ
jgi:hypothetical protein